MALGLDYGGGVLVCWRPRRDGRMAFSQAEGRIWEGRRLVGEREQRHYSTAHSRFFLEGGPGLTGHPMQVLGGEEKRRSEEKHNAPEREGQRLSSLALSCTWRVVYRSG